jgi:hypothetical protein
VAQAHKKGPVHGKFKRLADSLTPVASDSPPAAIKKAVEACAAAAVQILSLVDLQLVEVDEPPPAAPGPNKLAEAVERITTPGTAAGLVWTAAGGGVQYVECARIAYGQPDRCGHGSVMCGWACMGGKIKTCIGL